MSVGRRARQLAPLRRTHPRHPEANTAGRPATVRMVGIHAGPRRVGCRARKEPEGRAEGKGGGPLAKSRRQTNCGSNGRLLCSCAFPIGNSKRLRFFRTHTGTRISSCRMMARGAASPTICPITPKVGVPPASSGACIRYHRMRSRPVQGSVGGTCTSAASARGRQAEGDGLGGVFRPSCGSSSLGLDARSGRST
jgi:hypothetical protein